MDYFFNKILFAYITLCFLIFLEIKITPQSVPNFTQFYLQDYYYNPSLVGSEYNASDLSVIHRQWGADFFGTGPNTTNLGFDKSFGLNNKWGFAVQYANDNQGQAFSSNNFRGGLSYCLNPKNPFSISFGL